MTVMLILKALLFKGEISCYPVDKMYSNQYILFANEIHCSDSAGKSYFLFEQPEPIQQKSKNNAHFCIAHIVNTQLR